VGNQRARLQSGLTFDVAYMALQAAIDGLGVALGYRPYVAADIATGRLAAPFDLSMPAAGFDAYVVYLEATALIPDARSVS
jgi:LysR family glycine cleavage system transcriptional activator